MEAANNNYVVITRFKGIQATFNDGHMFTFGDTENYYNKELVFDNDKIVSATMWPDKDNQRTCGLEVVLENSNGERRTESIKCKELGNPVNIDLMTGTCYGITARFGNYIDSMGLMFI